MKGKMQGVTLVADWAPKPNFKLGAKDIPGRQTYLGSLVWKNPRLEIREYDIPTPGPEEVLLEVKACGICGSDVHMAQAEADGYIFYPGLTGFPCILGHEFSGVVVEAGKNAFDKRTNKPFKGDEPVTSEEMLWCAQCRPCADGQPNHCERLDEVGFNVNGAYAKYMVLPSRTLWSLEPLRKIYKGDDIFIAGSLAEPTSVAYNAVIERGGGIRPGRPCRHPGRRADRPGGLRHSQARRRIPGSSSPSRRKSAPAWRCKSAPTMPSTHSKRISPSACWRSPRAWAPTSSWRPLALPTIVYPGIERVIWEGRTLNSRVVVTARAEAKMPVTGEVLQVRRASIIGAQGHSGHGNFPRVIECMASGMDMTRISTKKITLEEVPANIIKLQTDRSECKITYVAS